MAIASSTLLTQAIVDYVGVIGKSLGKHVSAWIHHRMTTGDGAPTTMMSRIFVRSAILTAHRNAKKDSFQTS